MCIDQAWLTRNQARSRDPSDHVEKPDGDTDGWSVAGINHAMEAVPSVGPTGTISVYRHRTMTPAEFSLTSCQNTKIYILSGIMIGADRDPAYQRVSDDDAMT